MAKLPYRTATRMKVLMKTENDMDSVPTGNQEQPCTCIFKQALIDVDNFLDLKTVLDTLVNG